MVGCVGGDFSQTRTQFPCDNMALVLFEEQTSELFVCLPHIALLVTCVVMDLVG